jgi:tetratricopeptide (TPR) repeat protein
MLVGTVLYMSPEQVRGDELDVRSDVFAFGAVLYHATTNKLPVPGNSFPEVCMAILEGRPRRPSQVRMGFPPSLEKVLMRCLAADPAERFADGAEVYGALLGVAESLKSANGVVASENLTGHVLLPPLRCGGRDPDACQGLAGALRKDLASELSRIRGLTVDLIEGDVPPPDLAFDFVVRGELMVDGSEGMLDLRLETHGPNGRAPAGRGGDGNELHETSQDRIQHADSDEWGLQAGLVRGAVRIVRKRLTDLALRPEPTARRNVEESAALTARAHDLLHRGTTKHLLASISSFRRALEADPYCALAYAGMAEAMVRKYLYWDGDSSFLDEARRHASRALALDPKCAEAHTAMGFEFHMSGHVPDAQREYQIAIQTNRDEWLAHRLLGALRAREGNFKNAAPLLQRAIALKPTHIGSYDHLFRVLQSLDRYEESLEVADRGIQAAKGHLAEMPDNQEARTHLALLLARLGLVDEARDQTRKAHERSPKDGYTSFYSACVYALIGELDEALESLSAAVERGFFVQSELVRNSDLDVLRGLPRFQTLIG